jgi:hypothetical protein
LLTRQVVTIFVDATGCNTNQKQDGNIGGELFVLPTTSSVNGVKGACTDIHFIVLCFNNANEEALMWAIILKLMNDISQTPVNIKLGIDRTIKIPNEETKFDSIQANLENDVMKGGPRCTYNSKVIPCFIGCSPNSKITSQMLAEMLEHFDSYDVFFWMDTIVGLAFHFCNTFTTRITSGPGSPTGHISGRLRILHK